MEIKFIAALVVLAGLLTVGCSTASKNTTYMNEDTYKSREIIKTSILDGGEVSEEKIEKFLSGRISLPKEIIIGVVRLKESSDGLGFNKVDDELAQKFYSSNSWGARVRSVVPVPSLLMSSPINLKGLRQTAALLQANMLVILSPITYTDSKYNWLQSDKVKGITNLEVIVMDTKTGAIPFTQVISETVELEADKNKDYDIYESMNRAKFESEKKAILQVSKAVGQFLSTVQ